MVHGLRIRLISGTAGSIPGLAQWVEDHALPRRWHRSQMWLRFDPWPGNFHMPRVQPKKKKKKLYRDEIKMRTGNLSKWLCLHTVIT